MSDSTQQYETPTQPTHPAVLTTHDSSHVGAVQPITVLASREQLVEIIRELRDINNEKTERISFLSVRCSEQAERIASLEKLAEQVDEYDKLRIGKAKMRKTRKENPKPEVRANCFR